MTEKRYLPGITGCHECTKHYDTYSGDEFVGERYRGTYCDTETGKKNTILHEKRINVTDYISSKTFHPDCTLSKSRVKPFPKWEKSVDYWLIAYIYKKENIFLAYTVFSIMDDGWYAQLFIQESEIERIDIWQSNEYKSEAKAKAEAEKHWQTMINGCLI